MSKDNLIWMNPKTGAKYHAGIAFYDEEHGEYRAILDGPRTVFYLKPVESSSEETKYRVLAPIMIKGKFSHKVEMGNGYSNPSTDGQIFMTIGRYEPMKLVLVPSLAA
jgi:hypothetical protein